MLTSLTVLTVGDRLATQIGYDAGLTASSESWLQSKAKWGVHAPQPKIKSGGKASSHKQERGERETDHTIK